jgi:uncharacterized protein (TIGR02996 family)
VRTPDHNRPLEPLEAAVLALEQGRPKALAERLREAWRETRDPGLAHSYELLLREFRAAPLPGRDPAERAASWRERAEQHAGDPLELPVLLAEPWSPEVDERERLRLLAAWTPDPFLAATLAQRLRMPWLLLPRADARATWQRIIALLEQQRDPRQIATLDWLHDLSFMPREVARASQRLEFVRTIALGQHQHALAARLARRASAQQEHEHRTKELLAAVYADPDHDAPRLVYADWLTAHGDPRGEFIALQIERARADTPVSARERELLSRHGGEWAGAIHAVLGFGDARRFERGFLSAASVELPNLDVELVELVEHSELVERGEWSTLRTLDGHVFDTLARRGPLGHLRELYGYLQLERFVGLRADGLLAAVERYECSLADPNLPLEVPLGLRSLLVRRALDDALLRLAESDAIAGLEQLGVYYGSADTAAADHRERRSARHRFELLRGRLPTHVRELFLVDDRTVRASRPAGWVLTFERDELDVFSRLRVDWEQPANHLQGTDAVAQLLEVIEGIGVESLRRLMLGRFDDPSRGRAIERLGELADAAGCELGVEG